MGPLTTPKCAACGHYQDEHAAHVTPGPGDECLATTHTRHDVFDCACPGYTPWRGTPPDD